MCCNNDLVGNNGLDHSDPYPDLLLRRLLQQRQLWLRQPVWLRQQTAAAAIIAAAAATAVVTAAAEAAVPCSSGVGSAHGGCPGSFPGAHAPVLLGPGIFLCRQRCQKQEPWIFDPQGSGTAGGTRTPTYWFVASYSIQLSYCRASTDSFLYTTSQTKMPCFSQK